jgi:hypothetical protein
VVCQGQPPYDPKTLGGHLDQRREIDAWIRGREVKCALPQRVSVLALDHTCKPLFFKETEVSTKFPCIF